RGEEKGEEKGGGEGGRRAAVPADPAVLAGRRCHAVAQAAGLQAFGPGPLWDASLPAVTP
ncbi:MAG: hypothetical protein WA077_21125, partial [Anaerolineae bacterium]